MSIYFYIIKKFKSPTFCHSENCFITTGHLLDQYKRDSTVRIGKWRWPPPKEQIAQGTEGAPEDETAEGFLEFKMRKLQERKRSSQMPDGIDVEDSKSNSSPGKKKKDNHASGDADGNDSFDTSGEIQGKILLILLYLVLSLFMLRIFEIFFELLITKRY